MSTSKHLKMVKRELYRNLFAAYRGWWQWRKLMKRKGVGDKTIIILMPSCEKEINYFALLYLDELLKRRKYKNAILLTQDSVVKKSALLFSDHILEVCSFSRKKAEDLMQFYCLYDFDKRFLVASLDEPNGRNAAKLVGKRGTTKEEVFVIGVYRIYPFERPNAPIYSGSDIEIIEFLKGQV